MLANDLNLTEERGKNKTSIYLITNDFSYFYMSQSMFLPCDAVTLNKRMVASKASVIRNTAIYSEQAKRFGLKDARAGRPCA